MIEGEHAINEALHLNARLSIRVTGFCREMTLASFVHWTGLFFDGPLSGEIFYGDAFSNGKELFIDMDNCPPLNWHFTDARKRMGKDANHTEIILRGLQIMVLQESVLEHDDDWTLVDCVFKWLHDYTKNENELGQMLPQSRQLHATNACLLNNYG